MGGIKRLEQVFMGLSILNFHSWIRICILEFALGGTQSIEDI